MYKIKIIAIILLLFVNTSMSFIIRASGVVVDEPDAHEHNIVSHENADLEAYQIAIECDAQMKAHELAVSIAEQHACEMTAQTDEYQQMTEYIEQVHNNNSVTEEEIECTEEVAIGSEIIETCDINEPMESETYVEMELESSSEKYLGDFTFTYYCPCAACCGRSDGLTSSGTIATEGRTIAVDPSVIPYGSRLKVVFEDGFEAVYVAEDCGGSIKNNRIDIFVSSHSKALELGTNHGSVYLLNEG